MVYNVTRGDNMHRYSGYQERTNYRESILERDNYTCQLCGDKATDVDHIIPWEVSNDRSPSNLRALCHKCNCNTRRTRKDKRMDMESWLAWVKAELSKPCPS